MKYSAPLHKAIMDFLPIFHRVIHPVVNRAETENRTLFENQIKIIALLCFENKPLTPGLISRIIGIQKGSLTRMMKSLEELNLIERNRKTEDDRSYSVSVTPKGLQFFSDHYQYCDRQFSDIFSEMSENDKEKVYTGFNVLNQYLSDKGFENERF